MTGAVSTTTLAVLGAGSFGTALAIQFARAGHPTVLWSRDETQVNAIAATRRNDRYLPGCEFPQGLEVTGSMAEACARAADVLVVVPSHAFRGVLTELVALPDAPDHLSWATKGFELDTGLLPHQVAAEVFPPAVNTAVLSGPTFAKEVGSGLPTAMTVASQDPDFALRLAHSVSSDSFRAYTSNDIVGVEVGGAVKNALAIGAGLSDGLGFGANTRIALLTRGLSEMTRLGVALGAEKETFMGLSGMGDLVLTCTDDQSRNRRFGLALAAGQNATQAQASIGQVVEGFPAAKAVHEVARARGVEMPIVEQIYAVLYEDRSPKEAVSALMRRPLTPE